MNYIQLRKTLSFDLMGFILFYFISVITYIGLKMETARGLQKINPFTECFLRHKNSKLDRIMSYPFIKNKYSLYFF